MDGSSLKNLRMFRKLCGPDALENVLLTTTQWSNVNPALGKEREDNLRDGDFWGGFLSRGASLERFMGTRESGLELIRKLMKKEPKPLDIQEQMVNQGMVLAETEAGQFINEELISLQKKYNEDMKTLERERQDAIKEKDEEMKRILAEEEAKVQRQLEKATAELRLLEGLHEAEMRKREEAEREREEERERNDKAVIAVASKDISILAHIHSVFASYSTLGRLIYDTDDAAEFEKDPINVAIKYQLNFFFPLEVGLKTVAELFDNGMSSNNHITYNNALYLCTGNPPIKRGFQTFIIFAKY